MASAARATARVYPRASPSFAQSTPARASNPWAQISREQPRASGAQSTSSSEPRPLAPHLDNSRARSRPPPPRTGVSGLGQTRPGASQNARWQPKQQLASSQNASRPAPRQQSQASTSNAPVQTSWEAEKTGQPGVVSPSFDSLPRVEDLVEDIRWSHASTAPPDVAGAHQDRRKRKGAHHIRESTAHSHPHAQQSSSTQAKQTTTKLKPKLIEKVSNDVYLPQNITVSNLSRLLGVRHKTLQDRMAQLGMDNTAGDIMLDADSAYVLALEFDRNPIVDDEAAFDLYPSPLPTDTSSLPLRPPIITIMGHVDHGKTTLLDTLRSTSVASGEAGGITQHIGAFSVPVPSLSTSTPSSLEGNEGGPKTITFLDTPGHAAFSAMRARGARVTDIIVLVVAADDGVMPQTKEVIELARKDMMDEDGNGGGMGLVVALNKCDKPGVDTTAIKQSLLASGVQLEEFGGDVPCVEVSGLTGLGLDKLVETLSTLAEIKELRARGEGRAEGVVLESRVDKGRGSVATILVTSGVLAPNSHIIAGSTSARVRTLTSSSGLPLKSAGPGTPVTVSGWKDLPSAGDEVLEGEEKEVKVAVGNRRRVQEVERLGRDVREINEKRLEAKAREAAAELEASSAQAKKDAAKGPALTLAQPASGVKELRLIIKADVSGSVEAVVGALEGIGNDVARVKIVQANVGEVGEADVEMAKAVGGTVIGFSVKASNKIVNLASSYSVPLLTSPIIYRLIESVHSRVQALLPPIIEQRVLGEAAVVQLFDIKAKGNKSTFRIAGCRVTNGVVERSKKFRVVRDGSEVFCGSMDTLKHIKKDIQEARKGSECGLSLDGFSDFREGDKIQCYEEIERPGQL